ncbi:anti-phage dCTP deaminase [Tardiphaga sp.]|jgi:deoxycytidylate deaminase|uniref:anti-phage dCTP deaminase n=1 Tax=Tardiphaga sp. TaxID=1926292 RepID=UPI0037DA23DF
MQNTTAPIEFPELIFAIAGPIGIDTDAIQAALTAALLEVDYASVPIKLSAEMEKMPMKFRAKPSDSLKLYHWKIEFANALRRKYVGTDVLARIAIQAVRKKALSHTKTRTRGPTTKRAYLISQLKTPEEVELLRKVYGRQFILVSAYASEVDRRACLVQKLRTQVSTKTTEAQLQFEANKLMERDASESDKFGQQLRDTFHRGDVFVDGLDPKRMEETIDRFIQAFFGRNDITPTKDEYGMYIAKSASLRSADLSRQVGAAVFSKSGEIIVQGCNEVPKAHGGTYWDLEEPDHRDIKKGHDPNEQSRKEILRDLFERLRNAKMLSQTAINIGSDAKIVQRLTSKSSKGILTNARIMDLTEYGRIVHAEMSAVCDAARLGKSVKDGILYCTTFPCHNCTKHLLASGLDKVVFLEPYPKSQAKALHGDEIEIETENQPEKVSFVPFLGISPLRYRDIFAKGKRKDGSGNSQRWYAGKPKPMLDVVFPAYFQTELWALNPLIEKLAVQNAAAPNGSKRSAKKARKRRPGG